MQGAEALRLGFARSDAQQLQSAYQRHVLEAASDGGAAARPPRGVGAIRWASLRPALLLSDPMAIFLNDESDTGTPSIGVC